ncbi:hypothetical protein HYY75_00135, partial [bacterium]|nr:hypothetical protein [bacterium]
MYISLRVKILTLLLILVGGLALILRENASHLIREKTHETFESRLAGLIEGFRVSWGKDRDQLLLSAALHSESERIVNYSLYGLPHLLHKEVKRLTTNPGYYEIEIRLRNGLVLSSSNENPVPGEPLDSADSRLNIAQIVSQIRFGKLEMSAVVPIRKLGEFLG